MSGSRWTRVWTELHEYYKCKRCPDAFCCTKIPVEPLPDEIHSIADYLGESLSNFLRLYTVKAGGRTWLKFPCPFYSDGGCRIYEVRPVVCGRYPFAPSPGVMHTNICPVAKKIEEDILGKPMDWPKELEPMPPNDALPEGVPQYKTYNLRSWIEVMEVLLAFHKIHNREPRR